MNEYWYLDISKYNCEEKQRIYVHIYVYVCENVNLFHKIGKDNDNNTHKYYEKKINNIYVSVSLS